MLQTLTVENILSDDDLCKASSKAPNRTSTEPVADYGGDQCFDRITGIISYRYRSVDRAFRTVSVSEPVPASHLLSGRSFVGCAKRLECMPDILLSPAGVMKLINDVEQIHARLGEVLYISAMSSNETADNKTLAEAMRRFCRTVELCDDYLRGYYGLKLVLPNRSPTYQTKLKT